ncbi:hypothetical protein FLONG3_5246 [Fusarium longipes]|uniref:Uncharacterized protein n=1 Tax=Fusarium longipes TaxID=694270 RepID=A0A395SWC2_9HYPO|nr:hypothetical protein FLONG3_5246 [Fusarium longipes]
MPRDKKKAALVASRKALFPHLGDMYFKVLLELNLGLPDQYSEINCSKWVRKVLEVFDGTDRSDWESPEEKGLAGITTARCRRCTMQELLDLWTAMAREATGCRRLWAVSGSLRGNEDEPVNLPKLVPATDLRLKAREQNHSKFIKMLWTETPAKYRDPDWSGILSPTVTFMTLPSPTSSETDEGSSSGELDVTLGRLWLENSE